MPNASPEATIPAPVQLLLDGSSTSLVDSVVDGMASLHTRRAYGQAFSALKTFSRGKPLSRQLITRWRTSMDKAKLSSSTINVRLSAVRKLVLEAQRLGQVDYAIGAEMLRVDGVPRRGSHRGNWLTVQEARSLLSVPKRKTLRGKRNYAILAILLGCALRREELALLPVSCLQKREGRWAFVDVQGKGRRVRTVAVPDWVKQAIDEWVKAAGITDGYLVRHISRNAVVADTLSPDGIFELVQAAGKEAGIKVTPHDLRRTCAKLCRTRGGALEQIQILLGHESIQTTERYLGSEQDLANAVNDNLGL